MERIDKRIQDLTINDIRIIKRRSKLDNNVKPKARDETLYRQLGTANPRLALVRMVDGYNIYVDRVNRDLAVIANAERIERMINANHLARLNYETRLARNNYNQHLTRVVNEIRFERIVNENNLARTLHNQLISGVSNEIRGAGFRKPQLDFATDLKDYINNWSNHNNGENRHFEIILRPIMLDYEQKFFFKTIHHFNNWIKQIIGGESATTSDGIEINGELKDLFRGVVILQDIRIASGGCSKDGDVYSKYISTAYAYNTFSPQSRDNNCLFACIRKLYPEQELYLARNMREQFKLESGCKIEIKTANEIIKFLNLDIEIILFTEATELNKHQKYILYKDSHFRCIESFTKIDITKKVIKRGRMTFDLETRPDKNKSKWIGKTEAFELKDTICSVYYQDYKKNIKNKIVFTTDNESNSVRKFIDFLNEQSMNKKHYNIIAHNGGKFDFYFLISKLTKLEISTSRINMRGTTVIGLDLRGNTFRDSYCYLTNSLKDLSNNFGIEHGKQTEITLYAGTPREIIISSTELCYYKPELSVNEFMKLEQTEPEFWKAYCEYCIIDSMALYEIWEIFENNIEDCIKSIDPLMAKKCCLMKSMTIGGHSKTILKAINTFGSKINSYQLEMEEFTGVFRNRTNEIDDSKTNMEKYEFICKFKRGGISHCQKMGKHTSGTTGGDINSQYPASLIFGRCPVGKSYWTKTDTDSIINGVSVKKYGFYLIKNLKFNILSKILKPVSKSIKDQSLDWATNDLGETYVDSYLLEYLVKNCGLESYNVVKGLVSNKDMSLEKLFGKFVGGFYKLKAEQDVLKEEDHPNHDKYNNALRETIKLYLNSLTGKLVEDPSVHYQVEFTEEETKLDINGVPVAKVYSDKINNWIIAGVMVYSYSKRLLFEYINCLPNKADDVIHIETDGVYFPTRDLEQFKINLANYSGDYKCCKLGNELGNMKIEHQTVDLPAWFLGKKFYCIMENNIVERPFGKDKNIYRMRGVKQRTLDINGKPKIIVDSTHYERIYKGEEIPFTFSNVVSCFYNGTRNLTYFMTRTIKPMGEYKEYN